MDENKEKGKNEKRWGWLQLLLVILLISGAFLFSRYLSSLQIEPQPETSAEELRPLVEVVEVKPQTHRLRFTTTGTVQVRAMTNIVPQVSGRIVKVDANAFAGGLFTPETILFSIDKKEYVLALEQMKAEVSRVETELELQQARSETAAAEWRDLNPGKPVPPLVGETPQLKTAQAAVDAAISQLKNARLDLSRTEFSLPFSGRITELELDIGQNVVAGQSYGQAYWLNALEVDMPLKSRQLKWLLEAEDPEITVLSEFLNGVSYPASVKRIAAKLDPQTRMSRAILGFDIQVPELLPDVFVEIDVVGPERQNVWVLPLSALQENGGIWTVTGNNTLNLLRPPIIQITEDAVVAESDGSTIKVVLGNLTEATQHTPVRLSEKNLDEAQPDER
ncbi:MAG: efflux RND transporter periplasmic adaptor subunit [Desulforhopalus sp.]